MPLADCTEARRAESPGIRLVIFFMERRLPNPTGLSSIRLTVWLLPRGWVYVSTQVKVNLKEMNIGDMGATVLAQALMRYPIVEIDLSGAFHPVAPQPCLFFLRVCIARWVSPLRCALLHCTRCHDTRRLAWVRVRVRVRFRFRVRAKVGLGLGLGLGLRLGHDDTVPARPPPLSLKSVCLGSDVTRVRERGGVVIADCGVTPTGLTAIATAMVPSRGKWANALRKVR